jgi:hypothetical protein
MWIHLAVQFLKVQFLEPVLCSSDLLLFLLLCNIPLLQAHDIELFFEDTCMQVIRL